MLAPMLEPWSSESKSVFDIAVAIVVEV